MLARSRQRGECTPVLVTSARSAVAQRIVAHDGSADDRIVNAASTAGLHPFLPKADSIQLPNA